MQQRRQAGEDAWADIKAVYEQQFLPARDAEWLAEYAAAVERARSADEAPFRTPGYVLVVRRGLKPVGWVFLDAKYGHRGGPSMTGSLMSTATGTP